MKSRRSFWVVTFAGTYEGPFRSKREAESRSACLHGSRVTMRAPMEEGDR